MLWDLSFHSFILQLSCTVELQQFLLTFSFPFYLSREQHRLYSLLDYDRVVIMEKGKIIEDGNPRELKSNPKSTFNTMLNASDLKQKWYQADTRVKVEMGGNESGMRELVQAKHITSLYNLIISMNVYGVIYNSKVIN